MIRLKSPFKRAAAIAAGALLGMTGAVAFAMPASAHAGGVEGSAVCDTTTGEWVVTWTVTNDMPNKLATIKKVVFLLPEGSTVTNIVDGAQVPLAQGGELGKLTGEQRVPGDQTEAKLRVKISWPEKKEEPAYQKRVKFDGPCEEPDEPTPTPTPTPGQPTEPPAEPGQPTGGEESTCEELILTLSNPEDGEPITVTFTPSTGDPQTVTAEPGTTETVTFPGSEGLKVVPSIGDEVGDPIAWTPEDCETGGGGGGDLPVTGAAAGGIAGGAALLLAVGAGLFFMARRRRVTFTA